MPSGNEVTVSVSSTSPVTVTVPGSTGTTPTITNGGTANVTITSVGDRGPKGDSGTNGTFADAQSINAKTASYTLVLSDAGKLVTATSSSTAIVITIPAGSSVAFATGTHIDFARLGAGAVTISGASGVTVNGTPGTALRAQYSAATAICLGTDNWLVVGDLSS
jgi:hypothetical protein